MSDEDIYTRKAENSAMLMGIDEADPSGITEDFEQIPFGPEDDAPIGEELKARWRAKVAAKDAARAASQALENATGTPYPDEYGTAVRYSDFEGAIVEVDKEIAADPYDAKLLFRRGNLHMRLGQYDFAGQDYINSLLVQSTVDADKGEYKRAIDAYSKVLELMPGQRNITQRHLLIVGQLVEVEPAKR